MSIAENIKDARIKAGFSQQQLADGLGVTRQLISKWETGISMPDAEQVRSLSEKLHISYEALLDGREPQEKDVSGITQINVKSENVQLMIMLCLMILSCVAQPYGAIAAAANVVYCWKHRLGIFLNLVCLVMLAYTVYQFILYVFPQ